MTGGGFGGCVVALCAPGADVDGWIVRPVAGAARSMRPAKRLAPPPCRTGDRL